METHGVHITEAHDPDVFAAIKEEWQGLVERSERATIYQTWEWNEAWWRAYGRGKRLRLVLVRDRGRLIGLAPLYTSNHLGTPLRRIAFLGTGASDYMDVITSDERAPEVVAAVVRHLIGSRAYDLIDLQQLRPEAHLRDLVECRPQALPHPHRMQATVMEPCPFVTLPPAWDEYTKRLGKKMRSNLSYYDRLLPKTFENVEVRLAEESELGEGMEALFDLHQKRWNERLLPGVLGGSKVQQFHKQVAERFHANGWLRLHLTRIDKRTVAALYCFCYRRRYYYYLGGFAPDLAKYSLGTVLTAHAMRQAISEECEEFDFLRGAEPYKYRWMPEERFNHRLLLSRPRSIRSGAMLRLNRIERYVEHHAKAFAEKRGRRRAK
jgi:CelD/BcsL family acetyltransferase involved in cellulose biosynthesis